MKTSIHLAVSISLVAVSNLSAATHYVSLVSANPTPPYTNWATAATNIQAAVTVAATNDSIVVTNGLYPGGVSVTKPLALVGVNGAQFTVIDGNGTNRCIALADGASLTGFTLLNGSDYRGWGGGVRCDSTNALLTDCAIVGNSAGWGGGAYGGTLRNCTLTGNRAEGFFDLCGICGSHVGFLCFNGGMGGGAYGSALYNCALTDNSAANNGGGACEATLYNCTLTRNSATWGGGASADPRGCIHSCTLYNCTLTGNSAVLGGGAFSSRLYNTTVVGNAGSASCGGVSYGAVYSSIVYFNSSPESPNYDPTPDTALNYCDTTPLPTNGVGNISIAPLFTDYTAGNLRLQSNSPCIDAGDNGYLTNYDESWGLWFTNQFDLDGRSRLIGASVDMGAYEFQPGISGAFIAWLQQYGLATDGSADFSDLDLDGHNSWQEWICGTCPTNASSALCLLSASPTGTNVTVSWQSAAGINYLLERSASLAVPFTVLATNIVGQAGTTSYPDTNATGSGPFFYRVGVMYP